MRSVALLNIFRFALTPSGSLKIQMSQMSNFLAYSSRPTLRMLSDIIAIGWIERKYMVKDR
jgi:hypothetical protein